MRKFPFNRGDKVCFKDGSECGVVNFIGTQYITLTVRQWDDPGKMWGWSQCNLLTYPHDWGKLVLQNE